MNTNRRSFLCSTVTAGALAALSTFTLSGAARAEDREHERGERRYPRIQTSIDALREARTELAAAPDDFHGHKEAALHAVDEALRQLQILVDQVNHR